MVAARTPTLLRKLLKCNIRREQSLVLQSLRYYVDNGFFDAKAKAQEKEATAVDADAAADGGNADQL